MLSYQSRLKTRLTRTGSKPCDRLACRKNLRRRHDDNDREWEARKFCSLQCASRCSRWGHTEARRSA